MPVIALLDANVLYPAGLRDLLMQLVILGSFRARWTYQIHDEWIRNVIADRPDLEPECVRRVAALMDSSLIDAHIAGYEALTNTLILPDPNDCHVLAAAITGGVDVIVTNNAKDFPASALEPHSIFEYSPVCVQLVAYRLNEHGRDVDTARGQRGSLLKLWGAVISRAV